MNSAVMVGGWPALVGAIVGSLLIVAFCESWGTVRYRYAALAFLWQLCTPLNDSIIEDMVFFGITALVAEFLYKKFSVKKEKREPLS